MTKKNLQASRDFTAAGLLISCPWVKEGFIYIVSCLVYPSEEQRWPFDMFGKDIKMKRLKNKSTIYQLKLNLFLEILYKTSVYISSLLNMWDKNIFMI